MPVPTSSHEDESKIDTSQQQSSHKHGKDSDAQTPAGHQSPHPQGGKGSRVRHILAVLGPGVITGASDDDPSGIGTYSVAGAQFGYGTVWASLITYPLSAAVQEVCARIGLVTGHGLTAVIKHYFPRWLLYGVAFLLVAANTLNIGADIEAMAGSIHLVIPIVPTALAALLIVAFTLTLLVFMPYKTYSKYLKWVALVLFSYIIVALLSRVDWGLALKSLVAPVIKLDASYVTTLVAILGTTISPYMFFWQANMEVEEKIASGAIASPDVQMKHPRKLFLGRRAINDMHIDINVGMFYSELIMFFIIVSTAATIYKAGAKDVGQLDLAGIAQVLRPLAGDAAYLLFTLGIVGIGLLAIPVLAGSAAYALSEVFGWEEGLDKKFHSAKGFYIAIILATLVGLGLVFVGVDPVAALYYSAVINGVVAVPLLVIIFLIGNNKKIMGELTSGKLSNALLILTALLMGGAAVGLFLL
jgi:NRAMP (natural resistance-associated macrophage protein)-like metal ion transporter